jgi:RNA polymerase sigma factor (sigma-70 family)
MSEVTQILSRIESGDPRAAEQLLPLVYDELRKLAAARLAQEKPGQTLQATALVHEAYLRLVGNKEPGTSDQEPIVDREDLAPGSRLMAPGQWNSRGHFFGAAAEAMRRILVEQARRKGRQKRGGGLNRLDLDLAELPDSRQADDLLALNEALGRLEAEDPQAAELVKLRFFAGLSVTEAAEAVGISRSTAYEQWAYARAWLRCAMEGDEADAG